MMTHEAFTKPEVMNLRLAMDDVGEDTVPHDFKPQNAKPGVTWDFILE